MTLAEKTEIRRQQIQELGERIKAILRRKGPTLDLPTIEFYLQAEQVNSEGRAGDLDTFAVRNAVAKLVNEHEAAFTDQDEIQLTANGR